MSSASDPVAPFIGSKQHYDAALNSAGTTTRKRKFDDSDLQSPPELGEPFTIEVTIDKMFAKADADTLIEYIRGALCKTLYASPEALDLPIMSAALIPRYKRHRRSKREY